MSAGRKVTRLLGVIEGQEERPEGFRWDAQKADKGPNHESAGTEDSADNRAGPSMANIARLQKSYASGGKQRYRVLGLQRRKRTGELEAQSRGNGNEGLREIEGHAAGEYLLRKSENCQDLSK